MKSIHRYLTVPLLVVVAVVAISLRVSGTKAKAEQVAPSDLEPVAVALVQRAPLVSSLTLSGAFRPFQEVDVHAKVAGYIRRIYVDVGDKVREGQVLADLEIPELNAQVLGAEATIRRSQDSIRRAQSEVDRAESAHAAAHFAYSRLKQASAARPGLIAEQELDDSSAKDKESEAQVASARAALAEAQSQLGVYEASRKQFAALEAYAHITAPFSGVVTKRYADTGALIQAGTASNTQAMPVVCLAEWAKLRLVLPVPESAVPDVRLGSTVDVRVPAIHRTFQGRVARFADALDQQTRTMQTEIDVENRDGSLVDGMYAETNLVLKQKDDALTVPIQAVQREGAGGSVLIVDAGGRIQRREVTLGQEGNDHVEILSGLSEKDRVVVGNRSQLKPGDRVVPKVVSEQSSKAEAGS